MLQSTIRKVAAVAFAGVSAVLVPAAPAAAADPPVTVAISGACALSTGTETVTYTVSTTLPGTLGVEVIEVTPATGSMNRTSAQVRAAAPATFVETIAPSTPTARLKLRVNNGGVFTDVTSEGLTFACAEAHFATITRTVLCTPATGTTVVTWTVTARPNSRLSGDVVAMLPAAPASSVNPTRIRTLEPGHYAQTIVAGQGQARLTLKFTVAQRVVIGQKPGPFHSVEVNTPAVNYACAVG